MVEPKAWLYTKGDAWTVTKERTTVIYQPIAGYPHSGEPHYDFTETPLYGPEALAERDALQGPKVGVNCSDCGCRLPSEYAKPCPDCGTISIDIAALNEK